MAIPDARAPALGVVETIIGAALWLLAVVPVVPVVAVAAGVGYVKGR